MYNSAFLDLKLYKSYVLYYGLCYVLQSNLVNRLLLIFQEVFRLLFYFIFVTISLGEYMRYFTSDTHFSDDYTLTVDMRPFKNTKQYDNYIIKTWNNQTTKNDLIYVVGDFLDCDGKGYDSWHQSIMYVKKLKAQVILILGNNEERIIRHYFNNSFKDFREYCLSIGFKDVCKNATIEINNQQFYLTHKPINCKRNMLNLYGHIHRAGGIYSPLGFNINCDMNHYRLYSEDDILHLLNLKNKYWDIDKNLHIQYN